MHNIIVTREFHMNDWLFSCGNEMNSVYLQTNYRKMGNERLVMVPLRIILFIYCG